MSKSYCEVINKEIVRPDGEVLVAGHVADYQGWGNNELQIWVGLLNRAHEVGRKSAQKNIRAAIGLPN
jgi:hypothetical protein